MRRGWGVDRKRERARLCAANARWLHRGGRMKSGLQSPPVVAAIEDDTLRRHTGDLERAGADRTRRTWLHRGEAGEIVRIRRRVDMLRQNEQAFGEAHSQEREEPARIAMIEYDPDREIVYTHQLLDVARHLRGVELVRLALAILAACRRVDDVIAAERCARRSR